jgi:hypothetical protein
MFELFYFFYLESMIIYLFHRGCKEIMNSVSICLEWTSVFSCGLFCCLFFSFVCSTLARGSRGGNKLGEQ